MLHVAALILGCPTVGPPPTRGLSPVVGWVYGDDGTTMPTDSVQKATWEAFGEACVKGRSQSPINICTKSTQRLAKGSPSLHIHLQDEKMLPMNSGHNFELTIVDGQEKLYADVEGTPNGEVIKLADFGLASTPVWKSNFGRPTPSTRWRGGSRRYPNSLADFHTGRLSTRTST